MTIYSVLLIISWAIFIVVWAIGGVTAKRSSGGVTRWFVSRVIFIAIIVVLVRSLGADWLKGISLTESPTPLLGTIGVALNAIGIAFAIWARVYLGRNWGMPMSVKAEPELVTTGPYAYVRHPIYTGMLLALIGTALVVGLGWLIIFVLAGGYFIYAALQEEKTMAKTFPNQYPDYKHRTKMLIPFLF